MSNKLVNDIRNRTPIMNLLQSDETNATVIHAIIRSVYGEEAYDWDPLTICLELKDDFGIDANPAVMDKWCAMQVVVGSDAFFQRIDAFMNVCNTFASGDPMFSAFNPVTLEELAWGLAEVGMNRDFLPFSHTVKAYAGKILTEAGYPYGKFPPVFSEMFDKKPEAEDVRDGMASLYSDRNVGDLIAGNIADMSYQLNSIPGLADIDKTIIDAGIDVALNGKKTFGNK